MQSHFMFRGKPTTLQPGDRAFFDAQDSTIKFCRGIETIDVAGRKSSTFVWHARNINESVDGMLVIATVASLGFKHLHNNEFTALYEFTALE